MVISPYSLYYIDTHLVGQSRFYSFQTVDTRIENLHKLSSGPGHDNMLGEVTIGGLAMRFVYYKY